jgi:hypothetical protein
MRTGNSAKYHMQKSKSAFLLFLILLLFLTILVWLNNEKPAQTSTERVKPVPKGEPTTEAKKESEMDKSRPLPPKKNVLLANTIIRYGSEEGMVGMIKGNEHAALGPQSFTVDRNGNIFLADLVNERVVVYSSDGTYLRTIDMTGFVLHDIIVDDSGNIYSYDHTRRTLFQHDAQGALKNSLQLNPRAVDTRGYLHIVNNGVYFADAASRDVLLATLQRGMLLPAEPEQTFSGIHAASGRIYSVDLKREKTFIIHVEDSKLQKPLKREFPLQGVVSATFAGEDIHGRFFVQTETLEGNSIVLGIHTLDSNGTLQSSITIPNDYALWTAKLVDMTPNGIIAQFLPQASGVSP